MSVNDKVKIIWKTKCQWRDHAHWPKRRDIKLPDSETGTHDPLSPGDAIRVKFGSRWYDAKVAEIWEPKAKKGVYLTVNGLFWIEMSAQFFSELTQILSCVLLIL